MTRPIPGSPEWLRLVTASKVPAIVGASPYESPWSLWQVMSGFAPPPPVTEAMEDGNLMEEAICRKWLRRHPGASGIELQAWTPLGDWAGATPDMLMKDDGLGNPAAFDAKWSTAWDIWGEPGTDEVPEHIAVQLQWDMEVCNVPLGYVLACVCGRWQEYVLERDREVGAWLLAEARTFYDTLGDAKAAPALDCSTATLDTLKRMHPDIEDREVDIPTEWHEALVAARAAKKEAEAAEKAASVLIRDAMGKARVANTPTTKAAVTRAPIGAGVGLRTRKPTTPSKELTA